MIASTKAAKSTSLKKLYFPTETENKKSVLGASTILVSVSSPETQRRFATTPQLFILSLHFHPCEAMSAHSKHLKNCWGNRGAKESTHYNCCTRRLSYVKYMRILTTHKCSYNSKLLSHFSVFTPESARTLQRQMGPHEWCSAGSSAGTISNTGLERIILEGWWRVWIHAQEKSPKLIMQ